jgi:pimeloyl-ACP methyl ester carboxylesterase
MQILRQLTLTAVLAYRRISAMKLTALVVLVLLVAVPVGAQTAASKPVAKPVPAVRYGDNAAAGRTFVHDGVRLYFELYGTGEPLLMVHGNGGSIADMRLQIDHFKRRYQVIAMDSRDQGKSADSPDKITYEKMTDDLAALIDHLKLGAVNVVGWSDGGIEALLLGVRHPQKVKKIVAMAANLNPSEQAIYPEVLGLVKSMIDAIPAEARQTPQGRREVKVTGMMLEEPHIELNALAAITAPTLIIAGDHDLIRDEHTIAIYQQIPNSQLAILPDATHMVPYDDPATFNAVVERFLRTAFVKKDRIGHTMKSFEKMRTPLAK